MNWTSKNTFRLLNLSIICFSILTACGPAGPKQSSKPVNSSSDSSDQNGPTEKSTATDNDTEVFLRRQLLLKREELARTDEEQARKEIAREDRAKVLAEQEGRNAIIVVPGIQEIPAVGTATKQVIDAATAQAAEDKKKADAVTLQKAQITAVIEKINLEIAAFDKELATIGDTIIKIQNEIDELTVELNKIKTTAREKI